LAARLCDITNLARKLSREAGCRGPRGCACAPPPGTGAEARAALRYEGPPQGAGARATAGQARARVAAASHLEAVVTVHPCAGASLVQPGGRRAGYGWEAAASHLEAQLTVHPSASQGARAGGKSIRLQGAPSQLVCDLSMHPM